MKMKQSDPLARSGDDLAGTLFAKVPSVVGPVRPNYEGRDIVPPIKRGHVPIAPTSISALDREGRGRETRKADAIEVLRLILTSPRTIDEVSEIMKRPPNAVSGRFSELRAAGLIKQTESRRKTRAGSTASVWAATAEGIDAVKGGADATECSRQKSGDEDLSQGKAGEPTRRDFSGMRESSTDDQPEACVVDNGRRRRHVSEMPRRDGREGRRGRIGAQDSKAAGPIDHG